MSQNLHDGRQPTGPRPDRDEPAPASTSHASPSRHQGQAYSPLPSMERPPAAIAASKMPRRLVGVAVLIAGALFAGVWYGFSGGGHSPTPPAVASADKQEKTFAVAAVDADLKATENLKRLLSASGSAADADELQAINAGALKSLAKSAPKTAEDIKSSRRVLYRIYLLDFLAEDGDHVEFSVDGLSFGDLLLKGAGTSILIPLAPGTPAQLKVLATADGGGGVTVGFISSLGEARTRVMQVGDFDEWQVIVQ